MSACVRLPESSSDPIIVRRVPPASGPLPGLIPSIFGSTNRYLLLDSALKSATLTIIGPFFGSLLPGPSSLQTIRLVC